MDKQSGESKEEEVSGIRLILFILIRTETCLCMILLEINLLSTKYVRPRNTRTEMYAGRVAW